MKNLFLIVTILFLAACQKESVSPNTFTANLTGKASDVHNIVWGLTIDRRQEGSNYVSFGETTCFMNTTVESGEILCFEVKTMKPYTDSDNADGFTGEGVAYEGQGYNVTVIEMDDPTNHYPPFLVIVCYRNGEKLMSMGYYY